MLPFLPCASLPLLLLLLFSCYTCMLHIDVPKLLRIVALSWVDHSTLWYPLKWTIDWDVYCSALVAQRKSLGHTKEFDVIDITRCLLGFATRPHQSLVVCNNGLGLRICAEARIQWYVYLIQISYLITCESRPSMQQPRRIQYLFMYWGGFNLFSCIETYKGTEFCDSNHSIASCADVFQLSAENHLAWHFSYLMNLQEMQVQMWIL